MKEKEQTNKEKAKKIEMKIYLHGETKKAIQKRAIDEGTSMSELVESVLVNYIDRKIDREKEQ